MEESAAPLRCETCGRDLDPEDAAVVWIVAGRERLGGEWPEEHIFGEEQVRVFCGLEHANEHLRERPFEDRFIDATVAGDDGPGRLADVGCALTLLLLLGMLGVGAVVTVGWVVTLVGRIG